MCELHMSEFTKPEVEVSSPRGPPRAQALPRGLQVWGLQVWGSYATLQRLLRMGHLFQLQVWKGTAGSGVDYGARGGKIETPNTGGWRPCATRVCEESLSENERSCLQPRLGEEKEKRGENWVGTHPGKPSGAAKLVGSAGCWAVCGPLLKSTD